MQRLFPLLLILLLAAAAPAAHADDEHGAPPPLSAESAQPADNGGKGAQAHDSGRGHLVRRSDFTEDGKRRDDAADPAAASGPAVRYVREERLSGDAGLPRPKEKEDPLLSAENEGVSSHPDFRKLESFGILTQGSRSLGIDIWSGSTRTDITAMLEALPVQTSSRTVNDLVRRALLTGPDMALTNWNNPMPGRDLLTLRIEKLMQRGDYSEAALLYGQNPDEPYSEKLARLGVFSQFLSGQMGLGCLETKVSADHYRASETWRELANICGYFLSTYEEGPGSADRRKAARQKLFDESQSQLVRDIVSTPEYKLSPENPADLEKLGLFERAVLVAGGRVSYKRFSAGDVSAISPAVSGMLLGDKNLPGALRFSLMAHGLDTGLHSVREASTYYKKEGEEITQGKNEATLDRLERLESWQRLPYAFFQLTLDKNYDNKPQIMARILSYHKDYPDAAYFPFAKQLAGTDPKTLPEEAIRTGFRILMESAENVPAAWQKNWINSFDKNDASSAAAAYLWISSGLEEETDPGANVKNPMFASLLGDGSRKNKDYIKNAYEKLDKQDKLHNYVGDEIYEKLMGLTSTDDYVMPSKSLIERLEKAKQDKRLGEVILLSAIILSEAPHGQMHAELLRGLMDGFVTVGLTKEAQELAEESFSGLSN
jgi:hypothetical protein